MRGAILYATTRLLKRDVKVTELTWGQQDLVEGHQLQTISNADRSRSFAFVAMHQMKLYVLEGSVPEGYPPPVLLHPHSGGSTGTETEFVTGRCTTTNSMSWKSIRFRR